MKDPLFHNSSRQSPNGSCQVASPSGFGSTHPPVGNPFRLQADGDWPLPPVPGYAP
jgi:hypothetical protein